MNDTPLETRFRTLEADHATLLKRTRTLRTVCLAVVGTTVIAAYLFAITVRRDAMATVANMNTEFLRKAERDLASAREKMIREAKVEANTSPVIRTRKIELADGKNLLRASFAVEDDGRVQQTFFDSDGSRRVGLGVNPSGLAFLSLSDEKGVERWLSVTPRNGDKDWSVSTLWRDSDGKNHVGIASDELGGGIRLYRKDGSQSFIVQSGSSEKTTGMWIFDKTQNSRWVLGVKADGIGFFESVGDDKLRKTYIDVSPNGTVITNLQMK